MGDILIHYNRENLIDVSTFDSAHQDDVVSCRQELQRKLRDVECFDNSIVSPTDVGVFQGNEFKFLSYMILNAKAGSEIGSVTARRATHPEKWSYICGRIGPNYYEIYTKNSIGDCFFNRKKLAAIKRATHLISREQPYAHTVEALNGKEWQVDTGEALGAIHKYILHVTIDGEKHVLPPYRFIDLKEFLLILYRIITLYPLWSKRYPEIEPLLPQKASELNIDEQHILIMVALYFRMIIIYVDFGMSS